jgi:4-hydroxy-tetrahydrodipicolinate reductase
MRLLLIGYGKMGQLVAQLAREFDCEVAGIVDPVSTASTGTIDDPRWDDVDVAVDFTSPNAVMQNVPALARRKIDIVLGTTGWQSHEAELRKAIGDAGSGIVAAPNFSTGVVLF